MKKLQIYTMVLMLFIAVIPFQLSANNTDPTVATSNPISKEDQELALILTTRLNEINEMDKSSLSSTEKRALKKEVKSINKQLKQIGGGVYLTIGGLLLLIIILILIL
jgi:hypothetical protein